MRGLRKNAVINLALPSGSSPPLNPPGIMIICDCLITLSTSLTDSSISEALRFLITIVSVTAPAFSKAFAVNKAAEKKKVLYIPLEVTTSANTVFTGSDDALSLSDIFHDISTDKDVKEIKKTISRAAAYDENYNVYFIPPFYTVNDVFSVTENQFMKFMELISEEDFSVIVMDADFSLPAILNPLIRKTDSIVMVSNGTEHSNLAIDRIYNYINFIGENCTDKLNIIYNRFVNGTSRIYTRNRINILGGIGKLSKSSRKYIIENVSKSEVFSDLQ